MSNSFDLDWLEEAKASLIVSLLIFIVSLLFVHDFAAVFLYFYLFIVYFICTCVRSWSLYKDATLDITDVIDEGCFSQKLKADSIRIAVLSCMLELLTVIGCKSSFSLAAISPARILFFYLLGSAVLAVVRLFKKDFDLNIQLSVSKKNAVVCTAIVLCALLVSALFGFIGFSKTVIFASVLPLFACTGFIICFHDWWNRPDLFTPLAIAVVGLGIILVFPVTNLYSWDDQIHFHNANGFSFVSEAETTVSDRMLENLFEQDAGFSNNAALGKWPISPDNEWGRGAIESLCLELNQQDTAATLCKETGLSTSVSFQSLGYLPSACGIWLGRVLRLPFSYKFILGKLFNLTFYAFICYLAIKVAPCKKYLLSFIALLPSNVFMAANYSYDPWINCLTLFGAALLLRLITGRTKLKCSTYVATVLVFVFAFAPKAVYFPLLGLLFLIPSARFSDNRQKRTFESILLFFGVLVVISFLIPFIASNGGGAGDARGGDNVNSTQQVQFIMSNPLIAFGILSKFVFVEFLNPGFINSIATNIAYLGDIASNAPVFSYLPIILGTVICILDSNDTSISLIGRKNAIWCSLLLLVTCYLISTALYISFTGVACERVAGVQARYLTPLLFVADLFIFNISCHLEQKRCGRFEALSLLSSATMLYLIMFILLFSKCFG